MTSVFSLQRFSLLRLTFQAINLIIYLLEDQAAQMGAAGLSSLEIYAEQQGFCKPVGLHQKPRVFLMSKSGSSEMMTEKKHSAKKAMHGDWLTMSLLKLFVRDYDQEEKHRVRAAYGYLEGWVSIVANVLLFVLKFTIGLLINSISLIADSFHTLADVLTSVIVVVGFWISRRPADQEHPHGHGRFEIISTLAIAILLIVIGAEFFWSSAQRFIRPQPVTGTILVAVIILFSALAKEWLARFAIYLGKKIKASVLLADAWHHRSDAIASALVSVAIVAATFGYVKIDSVFGMLVSLLIAYTGYDLGRTAISFLMGEAPSEEMIAKIDKVARSVDGVRDTHRIMVHDYGNHQDISIHIQVDKDLTVNESHDIATKVQRKLSKTFESVSAEVHIEPEQKRHRD